MSRFRPVAVALFGLTALTATTVSMVPPVRDALLPKVEAAPDVSASQLANLPLAFEPNRGQTDPSVAFLARGEGSTLFVTPTESVLKVGDGSVRLGLVGANPSPTVEGIDPLASTVNHLSGSDSSKWLENVPTYSRVASRDVYPGIDMVWHGTRSAPEYDFVVSPGTDPSTIRLSISGGDDLRLDNGDLLTTVNGNEVRHHAPTTYQDIAGTRTMIDSAYTLGSDNTVGFRLGNYDPTHILVIDPVVSTPYVTAGGRIAVDPSGNVYVAGDTTAADLPLLNNVDTDDTGSDVFVQKLDPAGNLIYSTYLSSGVSSGGTNFFDGEDRARGLAVDEGGYAYVTGSTSEGAFPTTTGAFDASRSFDNVGLTGGTTGYATSSPVFSSSDVFRVVTGENIPPGTYITSVVNSTEVELSQSTTGSGNDLDLTVQGPLLTSSFVTKINPVGGLSGGYSTWLGGTTDRTEGFAIAASDGYAYVTGTTKVANFPTVNPIQPDQGGDDAFVTKLSQDGSSLVWSTYLGGSGGGGNEQGFGIDVDAAGAVYVSGMTPSTDFPVVNAYQPSFGGEVDAFLTKINSAGDAIVYSTYLGTPGQDFGSATNGIFNVVAADNADNAYVAFRAGGSFPTTPNAFQSEGGPDADVVVAKLNTATTGPASLVYATFLAATTSQLGLAESSPFSINVDAEGHAIVTGDSPFSDNFPLASPVQATGGSFITKLNASGTGLVWSTLFDAKEVALEPSGSLLISGPNVRRITAGHAQRIADFTADGRSDASVYRPSNNTWYAQGGAELQFGTEGDIAVQGDYNEDGFSDEAVFRPSNGTWYVEGVGEFVLGVAGDIPVPGDYDGDGDVEPAVYRPTTGTWFTSTGSLAFGTNGDIPTPGDYDADGDVEPAVFRPSNGTWYASSGLQTQFGVSGDVPTPGDYDGDGDTEPGVFRPGNGTWYAQSGSEAQFGTLGDIPSPGDYNADGKTDFAVFRPSNGFWYTQVGLETQWGTSGDRPLGLPSAIRQFFFV